MTRQKRNDLLKRLFCLIFFLCFIWAITGCGSSEENSRNAGPAVYVGSKNSDKYHYPYCSAAQRINPENLVSFSSPEDARASGYIPCQICNPPWESPTYGKYNAYCIYVIDGDTIVVQLNGVEEKVRLVGVDTPEVGQCFSDDATNYTKYMVENKPVILEDDSTSLERDVYGRILAYVYNPGNYMVNRELVRLGYGYAYTKYSFRYQSEFVSLESYAQSNQLGLWGACR